MPRTRSQTAGSSTQTKKPQATNCTAANPHDPKAGLAKARTRAAWRKAFWATPKKPKA